jgi:hypothetical protein
VRRGDQASCEFLNANGMSRAIHQLARLLPSTLEANVAWNGEQRRFEGEKRFDPLKPSGYCFFVNRNLNLGLLLNALLLRRAAVGF